jgi:hypothetical protein
MAMSRIVRNRVGPGDTIDATTLNDTYDDYSQSAALDGSNTREQAFDIVHFSNAPIILNSKTSILGNAGMLHQSPETTVTHTTSIGTPVAHAVQDSGGTETPLDLGSTGWSLSTGDVLRVWWNLSVEPEVSGTPWNNASAYGRYSIPQNPGSATSVNITDGLHCWVARLEWDITDNTLTNWTAVPDQSAFTQSFNGGADKGGYLNRMAASTVISAWSVFSAGIASEGASNSVTTPNYGVYKSQGYFGVDSMWAYPATGSVTVYGIRVVITGLMHPAHVASPDRNILLYDVNVSGSLNYKGGRISAVQMRGG